MKRAVVTGATSMVGVALTEECVHEGIEVLALVRKHSDRIIRLPQSELVTICECDLKEIEEFNIAKRYEVFYHLGWSHTDPHERNDAEMQEENILYTLNAVALAERLGCTKFIGAGSQAEYGLCDNVISPDTRCNPDTAYGVSKLAAGRLAEISCRQRKMKFAWGRIFSVYGRYDREQTMIMSAVKNMLLDKPTAFTGSEQLWDYLYSEDVGRAFYALGKSEKADGIYCIGSGKARELRDYIHIIESMLKTQHPSGIGKLPYAENQIMCLCADISKLTKDTGFVPRVSFEEGIQRTIQWIRDRKRDI